MSTSPEVPTDFVNKLRKALYDGFVQWVIQNVIQVSAIGVGSLAAVAFANPALRNENGQLWPASNPLIAIVALLLSFVLILGGFAAYRHRIRRSDENERNEARKRRQNLRRNSARKVDSTFWGETCRDPSVRRATIFGFAGALCTTIAIISLVVPSYAVSVAVWSRAEHKCDYAIITVMQEGVTVSTGYVDSDGKGHLVNKLGRGPCVFIVHREDDDGVYWSEHESQIDGTKRTVEIANFPEYRSPKRNMEPILFAKGSSEIGQQTAKDILDVQSKLASMEFDILLAEGRTCTLPVHPGVQDGNYELSLSRCLAVVERMHPVPPKQVVVASPLDHRFPLGIHPYTKTGQMRERSVRLVPLLRRRLSEPDGDPTPVQRRQLNYVIGPPSAES